MGLFDKYLDNPDNLLKEKKGITGDGGKNNSNNDDQDNYESLQDKKLKAETKRIDINNEKEIGHLLERKMVHSFLAAIQQSIQTNFINAGRINSPELAALLGIPEKEREINKFWDEKNGIALENVIKKIQDLNSDRMFDR